MKIVVDMVTRIEAAYRSGSCPVLAIHADLTKMQMQDLFIELWEAVGDEGLQEWVEGDGYSFVKVEAAELAETPA